MTDNATAGVCPPGGAQVSSTLQLCAERSCSAIDYDGPNERDRPFVRRL